MSRQTLLRLLAENAPLEAEAILTPLLELLSVARGAYGGDLDKFLVMLVIAVRAAGHKDFAAAVQRRRAGGPAVFPSLGVNIQSVADSIGAPKETIRRKVADLVALGWIERRDHELFLTRKAYETLTPMREAIQLEIVRHYELVRDILEAPDPAGSAD